MLEISKDRSAFIKGGAIMMMLVYHLFGNQMADLCTNLLHVGSGQSDPGFEATFDIMTMPHDATNAVTVVGDHNGLMRCSVAGLRRDTPLREGITCKQCRLQ